MREDLEIQKLKIEIQIKEAELLEKTRANKQRINTSVLVSFLGLAGSIIAVVLSLIGTQKQQIKLEKQKLNSSLIVNAINPNDQNKSAEMLRFLLKLGLIENDTLKKILSDSDIHEIPGTYKKVTIAPGFNDNTFGHDCPTVTVTNSKQPVETTDGCLGGQSIYLDCDTIIKIVIYFHNNKLTTAENVHVKLKQYFDYSSNETTFTGLISINNRDSITGFADIISSRPQQFTFGKVQLYRDKFKFATLLKNGADIFTPRGLEIGDVPGFYDCPTTNNNRDAACHEVWLIISFYAKQKFSS